MYSFRKEHLKSYLPLEKDRKMIQSLSIREFARLMLNKKKKKNGKHLLHEHNKVSDNNDIFAFAFLRIAHTIHTHTHETYIHICTHIHRAFEIEYYNIV